MPILRGSRGQRENAADAPQMMVPYTKPKKIEDTTSAALDAAKFMQKMTMPVTSAPRENMFSHPYLSAGAPGMMRPNVEAALMIASRYPTRDGSMPLVTAYVGMKKRRVNMPMKIKNREVIRMRNLASL